jgi:WD40 repeat protein
MSTDVEQKRRRKYSFNIRFAIFAGIVLLIALIAGTVIIILNMLRVIHFSVFDNWTKIFLTLIIPVLAVVIPLLQWLSSATTRPPKTHTEPALSATSPPPLAQSPFPSPQGISEQHQPQHLAVAGSSMIVEKETHYGAMDPGREDWGDAPHIYAIYGREIELATLEQWILKEQCRMVILLGVGGIGKTTLAVALVDKIKSSFEYILWRSLQNIQPVKDILQQCIQFFSDQQQVHLPQGIDNQIVLLIEYMRNHRCLLILDNLESILREESRAGQYKEGYEGYSKLITRVGEAKHQSCLLLTSREKPKEFARLEGSTLPVRSLQLAGVEQDAGKEILKSKYLAGSDEAWTTLVSIYSGNPLALKLISETIREVFQGEIDGFLKEGEIVFGEIHDLVEQQYKRLSAFEKEIMYWLAVEREPVSLEDLHEDCAHPVLPSALLEALVSLRRRFLIEAAGNARFTLQPVVMEYIVKVFVEKICEEIIQEELTLFRSHALIKAHAKDYVKDAQIRLILAPVAKQLITTYGRTGCEEKLKYILSLLRRTHPVMPGYAAGNVLNLLIHLQYDLRGYDFSYLTIWQADLQGVSLLDVSLSHSNITRSAFTDTFGSILSVAFSPDNKLLAASTARGEIRIWQVDQSVPLLTWRAHTDPVLAIAFSFNNDILVSGSEDQTVKLWEIKTGRCLKTQSGHTSRVWSVAFHPAGTMIASGGDDKTVRVWDVHSGSCLHVLEGHTNWIRSVAFSPDGDLIASGSDDQTVRLWQSDSGDVVRVLQGHVDQVWSVAFSPRGQVLASGSLDRTVRLWDIHSGQCLHVLEGHSGWARYVAFHPGGEILASGSEDQTIRLWQVSSGHCYKILQGHTSRVWTVAFSHDGSMLASGGDDQTIKQWETSTGHCLRTLKGHTNGFYSVAFSPDGNTVASGGDDQTARIWDIHSGNCLVTLRGHGSWICTVAFSPDGALLASGSDDQTARIWHLRDGYSSNILQAHTDTVGAVAFSPDGALLASGSDDHTIRLWNAGSSDHLFTLDAHEGWVRAVAFSPGGGLLASGSYDQTVRLWDIDSRTCLHVLRGHNDGICTVAFSQDGQLLASGSDDLTIHLWNTSSGELLSTLRGHTHRVVSISFNHDGSLLASGSHDGTIKLWDLRQGVCLKTLRRDRPYERMDITELQGVTEMQKAVLRVLGAIEKVSS